MQRIVVCLLSLVPVSLAFGAAPPVKVRAAPGEIVVFTAPGTRTSAAAATGFPLPVSLSGYSVVLKQSLIEAQTAVPVFSVQPIRQCDGAENCRDAVEIQAQIPFELIPNVPGSLRPENSASLAVLDASRQVAEIVLDPVPDNVRILTSCGLRAVTGTQTCVPFLTHANGEVVSAASPARGGEALVAYATGLGSTDPRTASGTAVSGIIRSAPLRLWYRFGANPAPLGDGGNLPGPDGATDFSGLTPGFAGLYQVQFIVPQPPPDAPACGGEVRSTLSIRFSGQTSTGTAAICAQ